MCFLGKNSNMFGKNIVLILLLFLSIHSFAQDSTVKWAVSFGGSFIDCTNTDGFVDEGFNVQIPNVSVMRYLDKGFTIGAGMTITGVSSINGLFINKYDVTIMDFFAKYDFGLSEEKWVPQLIGGVGLLVKDKNDRSISVNAGVGLTYWVLPKVGLNGQVVHRFVSESTYENFGSHTQVSGSLIVTFGESKGKRNKRRTGHGFTTNN